MPFSIFILQLHLIKFSNSIRLQYICFAYFRQVTKTQINDEIYSIKFLFAKAAAGA